VSSQSQVIRNYGQQLRGIAQERLLIALKERGQATVAACLQIFFNLNSLPEILLVAIDSTVTQTSQLSSHCLDMEVLVGAYPELAPVGTSLAQSQKVGPTPKKESQTALATSLSLSLS